MKPRKKLTPEEAEALLPQDDLLHCFRIEEGKLVGSQWTRKRIIERFKIYGAELSGDNARNANHGLIIPDELGGLFVETRRE